MTALSRITPTLTPAEFFEEVLLDELAAVKIPDDASRDPAVFNVIGAGTWSMGVDDEGLYVEPTTSTGAAVQLSVTEDDWRTFVAGSVKERLESAGAAALFGPETFGKLFLSHEKVQKLRLFAGDIQFQIDDRDEAASYRVTLTIGGAAPNVDAPKSKLVFQVEDVVAMLSGQANPQQLFMMGKLRVEGDMNLIMGLMGVMSAP